MRRTWAITSGSLVLGVSAYAFLIVAARSLEPAAYAPLAALWSLVFAIGPALFIPLEQEVARQLSPEHPAAPDATSVLRSALLAVTLALTITILLAAPWLALLHAEAFDGSTLLLAALGLSLVGYAALHLVRAVLLGAGRLLLYGVSLAGEGVVRVVGAVLLTGVAVTSAGAYGLVVGTAPLLVAIALLLPTLRTACRRRTSASGPVGVWTVPRTLSTLVIATALSLGLLNIGPLAVKLLARPDEAEQAGRLLAALVLARLPIFALPTLQASLLPRFAGLAVADDAQGTVALTRCVLAVHLPLAAAATGLAAALGPDLLELAFGAAYRLTSWDLAVLTAGATGHLLAMLLGLALIAHGRSVWLAGSWVLAAAVAVVVLVVTDDLLARVELALLTGAWTAVACIWLGIGRTRRRSPAPLTAAAAPPAVS